MPTFQRCPKAINEMADEILKTYDTHKPLVDAGVVIDYVFAYCDQDETGKPTNNALTHNGVPASGIAKKIGLKERALGRGDAEISLDHDHWEAISEDEQRALLDHELHHLMLKIDKRGLVRDDLDRPVIVLRKHDYEVGWFRTIAERHGEASPERIAAKQMADEAGQYFWPQVFGELKDSEHTVTISSGDKSVTMSGRQFSQVAGKLKKLRK